MKIIEDRYLGDGVYASYDGYQIWLDLRAQDDTTRIALDDTVLFALDHFRRDVSDAALAYRQEKAAEVREDG